MALPALDAARFLGFLRGEFSFFGGNRVLVGLFTALAEELVSEEPVKLKYLARRFEYVHRASLAAGANQSFLAGGLKEALLVDVLDVLFKTREGDLLAFLATQPGVLKGLGLTLKNVEVMLQSYSTHFRVSPVKAESRKFSAPVSRARVLPSSEHFDRFLQSLRSGEDFSAGGALQPDSDFCATPKYQIYLGKPLRLSFCAPIPTFLPNPVWP